MPRLAADLLGCSVEQSDLHTLGSAHFASRDTSPDIFVPAVGRACNSRVYNNTASNPFTTAVRMHLNLTLIRSVFPRLGTAVRDGVDREHRLDVY